MLGFVDRFLPPPCLFIRPTRFFLDFRRPLWRVLALLRRLATP